MHLDYLQQIRDSIHLVRIGGQNPLSEFQKKADLSFATLSTNIDREIENGSKKIIDNRNITQTELGIRKPSSTWTYMINDNPYGNKLSIMMLDNSRLGFQDDPIGASILIFHGIVERIKRLKKKTKES